MMLRSFMAVAMFLVPVAAQQHAQVGQKVPDATFPDFLNGDGRQKLSDFFGQPVVIDQWGTHCPPCVGTAVPNAIKHDHEHSAEGLVTILVESQGSNAAEHESFMWKTFPDNDCFACTGTHVPVPPSEGIPYCALIGVDGTLVWVGNPAGTPKPIDDFITAELLKMKKGWGDSAEAKKMRAALYGKNDIAAATAAIAAMPEGEGRAKLQTEIDTRYASLKNAIAKQKDHGNWLAAQEQAKALLKSVGANATLTAEVQPMVAEFDTDAGKAEIAFEKKFDKVVKQLRDKKGDNAPKQLKALAKDAAADSKVGARLNRTLTALETTPK